jgi:hypothetical protein
VRLLRGLLPIKASGLKRSNKIKHASTQMHHNVLPEPADLTA